MDIMIKKEKNNILNSQESRELLVQNIISKRSKNSKIIKLHNIFIYIK